MGLAQAMRSGFGHAAAEGEFGLGHGEVAVGTVFDVLEGLEGEVGEVAAVAIVAVVAFSVELVGGGDGVVHVLEVAAGALGHEADEVVAVFFLEHRAEGAGVAGGEGAIAK